MIYRDGDKIFFMNNFKKIKKTIVKRYKLFHKEFARRQMNFDKYFKERWSSGLRHWS